MGILKFTGVKSPHMEILMKFKSHRVNTILSLSLIWVYVCFGGDLVCVCVLCVLCIWRPEWGKSFPLSLSTLLSWNRVCHLTRRQDGLLVSSWDAHVSAPQFWGHGYAQPCLPFRRKCWGVNIQVFVEGLVLTEPFLRLQISFFLKTE